MSEPMALMPAHTQWLDSSQCLFPPLSGADGARGWAAGTDFFDGRPHSCNHCRCRSAQSALQASECCPKETSPALSAFLFAKLCNPPPWLRRSSF